MADTAQLIKEKLSIIDVVAPYVKLTKAGKYMRGLSPFTKEKTASFYVWPDRGSYYCFSTGQGGDHFTFIEKMEGVDFKGAIKMLAEKAGVEIVYERGENSASKDRSERLREAMAQAVSFFAAQLAAGEVGGGIAALEYAKKRGLTAETITSWQIGFSPDAWRSLLEHLQSKGFTQAELLLSGLIKEADGKPGTFYDRFRNRLMFPIRDTAGRTVAFTGRTMKADEQAKYLNSPETELYKKSEVLFGMDRAKDAIRTRGFAILVEGQFDLVLLHQIGFTNTVALSGTALSAQHLSLIKRYADNLMLCLDSDRAGLAASVKSAHIALASGMRVKAVRLPPGQDPADVASEPEGKHEFAKRVTEAQSIIEFFLGVLHAAEKDSHRFMMAVEETVIPLLGSIQSPIEREHFIGVVARSLNMPADAVRSSIPKSNVGGQGGVSTASSGAPGANTSRSGGLERTNSARQAVVSTERRLSLTEQRTLLILAIVANYPTSTLAEKLKTEYTRIIGVTVPDEPVPERALFEAGLAYGESPSEKAADDLLHAFEKAVLVEKLQQTTEELRRAEAAGDTISFTDLLTRSKELSTAIARF
jgi:DNA primase